ncbi:MAG: hypothetical protein QW734_06870 [Candidatus Bathyarchaeia archaeon]
MSEHFTASTTVNLEQNASAFAEVIAAAFGIVVREVASLFDFSVPTYSTADLLKAVNQSVQQLTSFNIGALKAQFPSLSSHHLHTLAHTKALLESIRTQPLVRIGIERLKATEWETAQNFWAITEQRLRRSEVTEAVNSAQRVRRLLSSGLKEVQNRLSNAQHNYVASSAIQVLREMGYQVQVARSSVGSWTSVWATKGGKAIGVVISPQSQMTVDMMGWEGTSCQAELISFRERMKKRGIQFREGKRYLHRRREGGALLQQASKLVKSSGLTFPEALLHVVQGNLRSDQRRRQAATILLHQRQKEGL